MSISSEITRLQTLRNTLRTKLVALGLVGSSADLDDCVTAVNGITNDGANSIGSYDTAMSKTTRASLDKTNLYEAIRWAMWTLRNKYTNAKFFVGTPIQRVANEQPEALLEAIKKMAYRYNFIVIDATNESGIVRDFESSNSSGRYLSDGLHPNTAGSIQLAKLYANVIMRNFLA